MTDILHFIDASPSPYHAVEEIRRRLESAGFRSLHEAEAWTVKAGGSYYCIRDGKTIVAWKQGSNPSAGFRILAAHTDSPTLKIKPNPLITSRNLNLLSIDVYGGPILHTWLDRDLRLAGMVYATTGEQGHIRKILVDLKSMPMRAPTLAVHLTRNVKDSGANLNPQTDFNLVFAEALEKTGFISCLSRETGVAPDQISGFDLYAADLQPSAFIGQTQEFISAPRLDNLFSCYAALCALIEASKNPSEATMLTAYFDAEELGSQTSSGARSNFLSTILQRIVGTHTVAPEGVARVAALSAILTVDMAHAEHPAFKDRTDERHVPILNGGMALKTTASANYGNSAELRAWLTAECKVQNVPLQLFNYRCDHGGGSTIGPMMSSLTGIRTMDIGAPSLSMHSVREMAGRKDVEFAKQTLQLFLTRPMSFAA